MLGLGGFTVGLHDVMGVDVGIVRKKKRPTDFPRKVRFHLADFLGRKKFEVQTLLAVAVHDFAVHLQLLGPDQGQPARLAVLDVTPQFIGQPAVDRPTLLRDLAVAIFVMIGVW